MRLEKAQLRQEWDSDRKKNRRRILLAAALTAAVFLICLGFKYLPYGPEELFFPRK